MTRTAPPEEAESFAQAYAAFAGALNRANASRLWWAHSLPGKNPISSPLPLRAWRLVKGEPDAAAAPSWKDRANRLLPAGPLWGFARAVWRWRRARSACRWTPEPGARYAVIATLVNHQSFLPDGSYRDTYFGDLSRRLAEAGRRPVVFGSFTADFERSLARSQGQPGAPIVPMELFLTWSDLVECLALALKARLLGVPLHGPAALDGADLQDAVREELAENARASRLFSDLWYWFCARAFLREASAERLYYPFENRAWERMLAMAFRESSPSTRLIGYQHAAMTANHLNYILGPREEEVLPLPDLVVTVGEVTRERLVKRGHFPDSLVVSGCALRQAPPRPARTGACPARKLLVTLATGPAEYAAVLFLLEAAFPAAGGPEVLVRPHPEFPLPPTRFKTEPSWTSQQAMDWADAVLYASSTLGLEAVRQGIPTVCLKVHGPLDLDPMEGFDALKWSAASPAELNDALAAVARLSPEDLAERRRAAADYAGRYLKNPEPASLEPLLTGKTLAAL